ncbi:MAG: DUF1501 domain-containing protein [Pseudomonadota bacterium]
MTRLIAPNRRLFLTAASAGAVALSMGPHRLAAAPRDIAGRTLMVIILRGALDGLAAAPPFGDPALEGLRRELLPPEPGRGENAALSLDNGFALHPALRTVHGRYTQGEAAILHATATPYRERSHFDGQDALEAGSVEGGVRDGWLNRALQRMEGAVPASAVGGALPLVLRGEADAVTWSPDILPEVDGDTLGRLGRLYVDDALFGDALAAAMALDETLGDQAMTGGRPNRRGVGGGAYEPLVRAGARLIKEGGVSVVSLSGWDTHANQGAEAGQLANRLAGLDAAIAGAQEELAPNWAKSAVLVVTEFGRTAAANGARGTDHGTGSCAFLLGGAVRGGRVLGDWPGLGRGALYENRDLYPANDLRSLIKGVLRDHLGVPRDALDAYVFPGSAGARPTDGLIA